MSNEKGFQYQLVGTKHAALLAVSLYTLRQYHKEPIQVVCGDIPALEAVTRICEDLHLAPIEWVAWEAPQGGKGRQHANKATGVGFSPFDKTIFLDADTTVHASLDELWPAHNEVHLTQFSTWVTTGGIMHGRLQGWKDILPEAVTIMQSTPHPAINTGVFSFSKWSVHYLKAWKRLSDSNPVFMSDELVAQLIYPLYPHVIHNDRFNYSPRYSNPEKPVEPIRVIHYHGMQHARPQKSNGWEMWTDIYKACYLDNCCGIRSLPRDRHLSSWLATHQDFLSLDEHIA